jgi:hypothetical protein
VPSFTPIFITSPLHLITNPFIEYYLITRYIQPRESGLSRHRAGSTTYENQL